LEFEFRIEYLAEGKIKRSDQRRNGRTFCWTYAASQEEKEGHNALDLAWLGLVANFLAREKKTGELFARMSETLLVSTNSFSTAAKKCSTIAS